MIKFYTVRETADMLSVSPGTVRKWTDEGRLPKHYLGNTGRYRIAEKDILAFVGMKKPDEPAGLPFEVIEERVLRECTNRFNRKRKAK